MNSNRYFKYVFLCVFVTSATVSIPTDSSSLFLPFGGRVATYLPVCVAPPGVAIRTVPRPIPIMYMGGSFSFLMGPPTHPGQSLLGMLFTFPVPCLVPCPFGLCFNPGQPWSMPIFYHGSSLI